MLHSLEALLPSTNLLLDCLPFGKFNFTKHVALNYDYFVELVDFRVDDLVLNRIDRP